jgi:hypothetical protein
MEELLNKILVIAGDDGRPKEGLMSKENAIRCLLRDHFSSSLNLLKNIHETSVGNEDKNERLNELGRKCGLVYNVWSKTFS